MGVRMLATSLGSWDTIETGQRHKHGITFPLAILQASLMDAGLPAFAVWEGDERPAGTARDYDALLISAMDSRHFWRVAPWLREVGCPVRSKDRGEADPIVVMGGQAATAPAPVEHMVDVVYVGEAEAHAADLVLTIERGRAGGWSRDRILEACAAVPGCLVPSHLPTGHVVRQVYTDDISVTLRERLWVNHRKIHRVEIARGCKSRCGFCALGWRSRYRENSADSIEAALVATREMGVREVHLSAGDAEAHSEIVRLRAVVREHGLRDHGWTGRLDTMKDCSVSAGKQFAFGLEGMSHRLRRAVGKGRLTDDYIVSEVEAYWRAGGRRMMFHLIGGLPTEGDEDEAQWASLMERLAHAVPGERQYLEIGRQPFGPLPHTPMQWLAPGLTTERIGRVSARYRQHPILSVTDKSGQSYRDALINAVAMRGGREVGPLMEAGPPRLKAGPAGLLRWRSWLRGAGLDPGHYLSAWPTDAPLPWGHIQSAHDQGALVRAHDRIVGMLR